MSGTHKYPTISFRISSREREEIEAKILASGMKKKDYFVRSCIYNRVCVVGKKETVYQIVEKLQEMQSHMEELAGQSEGVRRIAVCRMDVDNLGHAFISGFEQENEKDPVKRMHYVSFVGMLSLIHI